MLFFAKKYTSTYTLNRLVVEYIR